MIGQPSPNRRALSLLLTTAIGSACVWGVPAAGAAPNVTDATVRYELTGSGAAGYVTYQTNNGQGHATNVPLPWAVQLTIGSASSASHILSAQGVGPGAITCTVKVDGKVVSQNTATGDPARVVCESHGPPTAPPADEQTYRRGRG